jgi:phospholipid/cholesterol/gamma-HCH transport system substrate-binding protein
MPLVREDVRKLAENLELVQEVAPDLFQATNDALVTARTIATQKAAIATLITGGTALTEKADRLLDENKASLVRFIDNSARLLDIVYTNRRAGISEALVTNRVLYDKLKTIHKHGYLDSITTFELNVPPYYTKAQRPSFSRMVGGAR